MDCGRVSSTSCPARPRITASAAAFFLGDAHGEQPLHWLLSAECVARIRIGRFPLRGELDRSARANLGATFLRTDHGRELSWFQTSRARVALLADTTTSIGTFCDPLVNESFAQLISPRHVCIVGSGVVAYLTRARSPSQDRSLAEIAKEERRPWERAAA